MILRPYQETGLAEIRAALRQRQSVLYVAPCGSGKGSLISFMVNTAVQRNKRVIFAVHGKALVHDMSQRVSRLGIQHGVLMGSHRRERWHPVQVASIDTLHRMEFPPAADLIICDECHMSLSDTWRKTIARYPAAKIVGCTATPVRLDKQGLGRASGGLFDAMVVGPTEQELIDMGHLVRSRVLAPPPPADLGAVKKTAGEFNAKAQAVVCDKAKVIGDIVEHWRKHAEPRSGATAVFGVDQAHALHIAEQFRGAGFDFAYVDAETPDVERGRIWADLDNRRIRGVCSVGCLSVGWDHSIVDCIVAARKTASLGLWRQILGRGSRPYPGKTEFLVLDHVGNSHEHFPYGLFETPPEWCLDGEAVKRGTGEYAMSVTTCKACYATFKTGPDKCPFCGVLLTKKAREIQVEQGELEEFAKPKREYTPTAMLGLYAVLRKQQEQKGYKPAWCAMVFKSKTGHFPPGQWRQRSLEELEKALPRNMETVQA